MIAMDLYRYLYYNTNYAMYFSLFSQSNLLSETFVLITPSFNFFLK